MKEKKTVGRPELIKYNGWISPCKNERDENWPEHLQSDGRGLDYRVPPPPWDAQTESEIHDNLLRLRIDPTSTNGLAVSHPHFARALLSYPHELDKHQIAEEMAELLSQWGANEIKTNLLEIVRMAEERDKAPHPNYHALRAYYDFVREFGFDPTQKKLMEYLVAKSDEYPLWNEAPLSGSKQWWDLFLAAGLSRLAGSKGQVPGF